MPDCPDQARPPSDDGALLRRALADPGGAAGRAAASQLFALYQRRVYLWCYRYVRDHERALDMAQEVLLKAYRALDSLDDGADFGAWLFVIARNRCLSELRRPALPTDDETEPDALVSQLPLPDDALIDRLDEQETLDLIDAHLAPLERTALWLRCFEKLPVDEITAILGIEEATGARAVLQRARRKLTRALAERRTRQGGSGS